MFKVTVFEKGSEEIQEVRIVSEKEMVAIRKGYSNDPFYGVDVETL